MAHIALIGAGYWGSNILKNLISLDAIYGYVDDYAVHPEVRKLSMQEVLNDPSITGVMIATPSNTHASIIEQCLKHKKHVFVEKPICLSLTEADRLSDLAKEQNLILMIGYLMMFHPATQGLKNQLTHGKLKDCTSIIIQRQAWMKPRAFESVIWDLTVHDISMLYYLFNDVPTHTKLQTHQLENLGIDSLYYRGTIAHPNGHMVDIQLTSSWLSPIKSSTWTLCTPHELWSYNSQNEFQLHSYAHDNLSDATTVDIPKQYPLQTECEHFISCIQHKTDALTSHPSTRPIMKWLDDLNTQTPSL